MSVLEKKIFKSLCNHAGLSAWLDTNKGADMKLTQQSAVDHMTYECQTVLI